MGLSESAGFVRRAITGRAGEGKSTELAPYKSGINNLIPDSSWLEFTTGTRKTREQKQVEKDTRKDQASLEGEAILTRKAILEALKTRHMTQEMMLQFGELMLQTRDRATSGELWEIMAHFTQAQLHHGANHVLTEQLDGQERLRVLLERLTEESRKTTHD